MKVLAILVAVAALSPPLLAQRAEISAKALFEAGQYEQAIRAVAQQRQHGMNEPADTYLSAQSYQKLGQPDRAKAEFAVLADLEDAGWRLVGGSAKSLIDGDIEQALQAATHAAAEAPDFFFARYQLGLVKAERQDWNGAADAFERASQTDPTFAYAHYYAGLAYSKVKRADRTAAHFEVFLKLAPKAPERPAVESIMRTLRGR